MVATLGSACTISHRFNTIDLHQHLAGGVCEFGGLFERGTRGRGGCDDCSRLPECWQEILTHRGVECRSSNEQNSGYGKYRKRVAER